MINIEKYKYDISIIIPVYNTEKYVDKCILSVINQLYDFNRLQIILINDGSTDNSFEICKKYSESYSNILLLSKENSGVSETRNIGIKNALGKYIMFLDSDDYLSLNCCKELFNFFEKHYSEVDIVTYTLKSVKNNVIKTHYRYEKLYKNGTDIYDINENPYLIQTTINVIIKNMFNELPEFNEKQIFAEDERFNTELVMLKLRIGFCKSAEYYYVKHNSNTVNTVSLPENSFETTINYYNYLFDKFSKNNIVPSYIQALFLNCLRWRLKDNLLFPVSAQDKNFKDYFSKLSDLITRLSPQMIINDSNLTLNNKLFILTINKNINININDNYINFTYENLLIDKIKNIEISILNIEQENSNLIFKFNIKPDILYIDNNLQLTLKDSEQIINIEKYNCDFFDNRNYILSLEANKLKNKQLFLQFKLNNFVLPTIISFNDFSNCQTENYYITVNKNKTNSIYITNKKIFKNIQNFLVNTIRCILKPKVIFLRLLSLFYRKNRYLYIDDMRTDLVFNKFRDDLNIDDNITRYFVTRNISNYINTDIFKNNAGLFLTPKSKLYKINSLVCKKVFINLCNTRKFTPFEKHTRFFKDIMKYKLIDVSKL